MAAPAYTTDLTDIYIDTDNFSTVGGGRVTDAETDDYIQGNNCWSHDPFSSGTEGGVYDSVTAETIAADDAVFIWMKCDVVATLGTHAAGGMSGLIGNGTAALKVYYLRGSDDYEYGGWICIPIDPTLTPSTNIGSPSGVWDHFGVQWYVPASGANKGYPMKIDAIRHGRQIEITAGDSGTPATWDATAIYDSANTRQWGICQPTNTGAALQGLIYWGTAATAIYSRDSNRTIVLNDTEWTSTDFTQILFANAGNDVIWENVSISALGTNNKGIINITANGDIVWKNSVFSDIDTTILGGAKSIFTSNKWIGCGLVTQTGGTITSCLFDNSTGTGLLANDIALVTKCIFNSKGTGYAVNLGTIDVTAGDVSVTWDNTATGYGSAQTTNAVIQVNVTGGGTNKLIINVTDTATTPTVNNTGTGGASDISVVAGQKTLTFTDLPDGVEVRVRQGSYSIFYVASASGGSEAYSYSYVAGTIVQITVGGSGYVRQTVQRTLENANASISFALEPDPSYIT